MKKQKAYELLGLSSDASEDEVKSAFRNMAKKHHPDKGGDEEKFKEINEAYQILTNSKNDEFDDPFGGGNPFGGNPFGGSFNINFGNQRQMRNRPNIGVNVQLSFVESIFA